MTSFYAQPYDISATGFYFDDAETYAAKIQNVRNDYGQKVEEFEIQFIDGDQIDAELCKAIGIHQGNIVSVMDKLDEWADWQKVMIILATQECGYSFDPETDEPDNFDIDVYQVETMRELAEQFVDEGLFGDIPEHLQHYIDYDAIARDFAIDYAEASINGANIIYRCG